MVKRKKDSKGNIIFIVAILVILAFILFKGDFFGGDQCNPGEERCSGVQNKQFQTCGVDKIWNNQGFVDGKCGWSEDTCIANGFSCSVSSDCCSNQCSFFQCA